MAGTSFTAATINADTRRGGGATASSPKKVVQAKNNKNKADTIRRHNMSSK